MDEARAERIERLLDDVVRNMLPRREFERRMDKFDVWAGDASRRLAQQEAMSQFLQPAVHELADRMNDVEDVSAVHVVKERRKGWIVPALVTGVGVLVNATLAAITFALGTHR
jgi:hypothetical protein